MFEMGLVEEERGGREEEGSEARHQQRGERVRVPQQAGRRPS